MFDTKTIVSLLRRRMVGPHILHTSTYDCRKLTLVVCHYLSGESIVQRTHEVYS